WLLAGGFRSCSLQGRISHRVTPRKDASPRGAGGDMRRPRGTAERERAPVTPAPDRDHRAPRRRRRCLRSSGGARFPELRRPRVRERQPPREGGADARGDPLGVHDQRDGELAPTDVALADARLPALRRSPRSPCPRQPLSPPRECAAGLSRPRTRARRGPDQPPGPAADCAGSAPARFNPWRMLLLEKIPFLVLAAASSVVAFFTQRRAGVVVSTDLLPLGTRIANAVVSYATYLVKMIAPV